MRGGRDMKRSLFIACTLVLVGAACESSCPEGHTECEGLCVDLLGDEGPVRMSNINLLARREFQTNWLERTLPEHLQKFVWVVHT